MRRSVTTVEVGEPLELSALTAVAAGLAKVAVSKGARKRIERARAALLASVRGGDDAPRVYGVNTGFGALSEVPVSRAKIRQLQKNLVRSHACGVGPSLPRETVRAMMLLRAQVLALGHSGVRPDVVDTLCALLDAGVHPVIPEQGSVGASGDLAPLAHLALVLIGEGEAELHGHVMPAAKALAKVKIAPLELHEKEGLALINGTQLMTARAAELVVRGEALCRAADLAGAMSVEALKASHHPFEERVHALRPHPGQVASAANMRKLLAGSEIEESHADCGKVQDSYSLRCLSQVHGAARDALAYVRRVVETELNSVTDNPLAFAGARGAAELVSAGNFHGQPLAVALDVAAIALASLANISERRIEQLVNPVFSSGLPPFLATETGLDSGFMIAQVTAASLVSENKVLTHPASVDSIPSSAGKEDHVSMGATAARKAILVLGHVTQVLAIEILVAAQGLDLRLPLKPGAGVAAAHKAFRKRVRPLNGDRILAPDIAEATKMVADGSLLAASERGDGVR